MRRHVDKIPDANYERGYVYNFHFHLIWVTKYRRQVFVNEALASEMKGILYHIAGKTDVVIEAMEVMPDHVHLLISFKPKYSPTDIVKNLKGSSARIFFQAHPEIKAEKLWGGHLWSNSYFISTLGNMSKDVVESTSKINTRRNYNAQFLPWLKPQDSLGGNC